MLGLWLLLIEHVGMWDKSKSIIHVDDELTVNSVKKQGVGRQRAAEASM